MKIFDPDDPLVLAGIYDVEGYKPGERVRLAKAKARAAEWRNVNAPGTCARGHTDRQPKCPACHDMRIAAASIHKP